MVNGFDAPRYGARDCGTEGFLRWKLYKDIPHGTWMIELFDEMGNRIDSCKRRTRQGCMSWLVAQEVRYANAVGK